MWSHEKRKIERNESCEKISPHPQCEKSASVKPDVESLKARHVSNSHDNRVHVWSSCDFSVSLDTEWIPLEAPRRKSGTLGGDEQSAMMPCSRRCFLRIGGQIYSLDYMSALVARLCAVPTIKPWVDTKSLCPLGSSMEILKKKMIIWLRIKQEAHFSKAFSEQVPEPSPVCIISSHHSFLPNVWQLIRSKWTNIDVALFLHAEIFVWQLP